MSEAKGALLEPSKAGSSNSLVTIIIPAFNHAGYVEQSLLSAINQTYDNIEIIVIDDGSTDDTPRIIEKILHDYSHKRDVTFLRQSNQGLSRTLNIALSIAKGNLIQFLASDDAYLPEKTSKCVEALMNSTGQVAGVYSDGYLINSQNEKVMRFSDKYLRPLSSNTHKELLLGNWIPALGALYKKEAIDSIGGFDETLAVEDYDFLLRLTKSFHLTAIPEKLFLYRWHENNFSKNQERMAEQFANIAKKHHDLGSLYEFKSAIRRKSLSAIIGNLSWLNLELTFRSLIRKIQINHGLQNISHLALIHILCKKTIRLAKARGNAALSLIRGIQIGKGAKIYGRIRTVGNNKNIHIGNRAVIFGDVTIIATYSHSNNQIFIGDDVVIENNSIIFSLGGQIHIGNGCFIGPNVILQANGDVHIGDNTMIASNSSVYANNHIAELNGTPFKYQGNRFAGITIGKNCWVGTNVSILDGTTVSENTVIGANCVVKGNHDSDSVIVAKGVMGQDLAKHRYVNA